MRTTDARRDVLAVLDRWLQRPSALPVVRVLEGTRPQNPSPSFFMEAPRLILVIEGRAHFLTITNGQEVTFEILPGQVLFLAPYTWICPVPRMAYKSLGAILRPDSTRLTIHARRAMTAEGRVSSRYLAEWRTQETLGARGTSLWQLLLQEPAVRLGERSFALPVELLIAHLADLVESASEAGRPSQAVLWQSVGDYVLEHWSDPGLSRKAVANYFNRHPNHFSRFFHLHAHKNFRAYVNEIRLDRSMHFLRDLRYNVTDVAGLCGFTDLQYFIRCFRRRFGFTPGEYRRRRET